MMMLEKVAKRLYGQRLTDMGAVSAYCDFLGESLLKLILATTTHIYEIVVNDEDYTLITNPRSKGTITFRVYTTMHECVLSIEQSERKGEIAL